MTTGSSFGHGDGPPFGRGVGDDAAFDADGDADLDERSIAEEEAEAAAVVESDLAELQTERSELVDTLRRVQADFENYRKRVIREQTTLVERANERLIEDLLPVLDSFDGALTHAAASDAAQIIDGVTSIRSQLVAVLEKNGLERIDADGVVFDPNEHEAVMQDEGPADPRVAETMRTGYRLKGRVVRPAMVRVTREG